MPGVSTALRLNDVMTATLRRINRAMSTTLDSFQAVQQASGQTFDDANIAAARHEIDLANRELDAMAAHYNTINNGQNNLNRGLSEGASAASGLVSKIKSIAGVWLGMKGVNWVKESFGLFDIQNNAENQLKTTLKNMGGGSAFGGLKDYAAELQGGTMYGDEALIGGAAEFATYMQDEDAIKVMMGTLTDYAAGMSGGAEVGYEEMVNYATNLGKITTGSFDAMTKKGFQFTDAQKKIIENGTDMEKALVISDVINESWAGLAKNMANTPQGKIVQMKNAFGDMREELAAAVYPAVMMLFETIGSNTENIKGIITGLAKPINLVINVINKVFQAASKVYMFFKNNWTLIKPIVASIVTIIGAYNAALLVHKGVLAAAAAIQGIKTVAEYASAKATLRAAEAAGVDTAALTTEAAAAAAAAAGMELETIAQAQATVAQGAFNTALWACPITWIIAALLVLIVVFVMFTENLMATLFWWGALFKNVGLWIANLGLATWAVIKNVGLWFANLGLTIWAGIKNIGLWFANLGQAIWAIIQNVGAWFGNVGMGIWNVLCAVASNIATAFKNGWLDIQIGFWAMVNVIMQGVKKVAEFANKCLGWMGVHIDTSGLDFAANKIDELNSKRESYKDIGEAWDEGFNTFAYQDVGAAMNTFEYEDANKMNTFEYDDVGKAFGTFDVFQDGWDSGAMAEGYAVGSDIKGWMNDTFGGLFGGGVEDTIGYGNTLGDIASDTSDIADCGDKTNEELAYLRDIAEQEAINRFTTAEIKIDFTSNNNISSDMDVDGMTARFTQEFANALETAAEGVY